MSGELLCILSGGERPKKKMGGDDGLRKSRDNGKKRSSEDCNTSVRTI